MGIKQPAQGHYAEHHAIGYAGNSFQEVTNSAPASPFDLVCRGLKKEIDSGELYQWNVRPTFYIQVKGTTSRRPGSFPVRRSTFNAWLRTVEEEPVVILSVHEKAVNELNYRFLVLHDWLLSDEGQRALTDTSKDIYFNLNRSFELDDTCAMFHNKMKEEADRVLQANDSPWATLRDYGLLPLSESTMLEYMELAHYLEVPTKIFTELTKEVSPREVPLHMFAYLSGIEIPPSPLVSEWVERVKALAPDQCNTSFERRQFAKFRKALNLYKPGAELPQLGSFQSPEIGTWRSFVAMYPRSLPMLEETIRYSPHEEDVMFAAAMLPTLAATENRQVQTGARKALLLLENRAGNFGSYRFQRECLRAPAEGGIEKYQRKVVDFLKGASAEDEMNFLNNYGWVRDSLRVNLERKLKSPTARDEQLRQFYEATGDKLL